MFLDACYIGNGFTVDNITSTVQGMDARTIISTSTYDTGNIIIRNSFFYQNLDTVADRMHSIPSFGTVIQTISIGDSTRQYPN